MSSPLSELPLSVSMDHLVPSLGRVAQSPPGVPLGAVGNVARVLKWAVSPPVGPGAAQTCWRTAVKPPST